MGAPQFDDDGEQCWHEAGADVPWWLLVGWLILVAAVLAMAGSLILAR